MPGAATWRFPIRGFACGTTNTSNGDDDDQPPPDVTGTVDVSPSSLDFGQVSLAADPGVKTIMITNRTNVPTGFALELAGADASAFTIARTNCNGDVPLVEPGASCTADIALAIGHLGAYQAQLDVVAQGDIHASASLAALALNAELSISPANDAYGDIVLGRNTTHEYTLTNTGEVALPAPQLALSDAAYKLTDSQCSGTLAPAGSCKFQVTFAPTALGIQTGSVSVAAGHLTAQAQFSGRGTGLVTAALAGNGGGTVTGTGMSCGVQCTIEVAASPVNLLATANKGSKFAGWTGAAASCGTNPQCTIAVTSGTTNVGATFNDLPTLTVVVGPTANPGSVKLSTPIATCDTGTCSFDYLNPTTVTITPVKDPTGCVLFDRFGGACVGQTGTCTVTVNANISVTATFKGGPNPDACQ